MAPPSDLPDPPRRLRRRAGWGPVVGLWFLRLFILPHTLVGIGLIAASLFAPFLWLCGVDVPGEITKLEVTRRKGDEVCNVHYVYTVYNVAYANATIVSAET